MNANNVKLNVQDHDEIIARLSAAVLAIQQESGYGSIEITVHDGKVTQIERREKYRFQPPPTK